MATFNDEVILVKKTISGYDEYGNPIRALSKRTVFCNELSVYGTEFYNAASIGLKPQAVLSIHFFEYENEEKVIYKGQELDILRHYKKGDYIELTVGEKIG